MNVSFVIPALNEAAILDRCLSSIRGQRLASGVAIAEIILVDAGSTDHTVTIAESFQCRVIAGRPGNISRSRNQGAAAASGDLIAFLDADAVLDPDWLTTLSGCFGDSSVVGVAAPMAKPLSNASWVESSWYRMTHRSHDAGSVNPAPWLPSLNLLVRRTAFVQAGGFDESLITCEDTDLGYRLSRQGTLLMDHRVTVRHLGESRTLSEFARREAWRARGNWSMLTRHGFSAREFISTMVPIAFTVCAVMSLAAGLLSLLLAAPFLLAVAGGFAIAMSALPLLMLIRSRVRLRDCGRCAVLAVTYLLSRTYGMVVPARRVPREAATTRDQETDDHQADVLEVSAV